MLSKGVGALCPKKSERAYVAFPSEGLRGFYPFGLPSTLRKENR